MTTHAPSSPALPFIIGLKPLDDDDFLIIDGELPRYLVEKRALYANQFDSVFQAKKDTIAAQKQVLEMVITCLKKHHSERFCFDGNQIGLKTERENLLDIEDWPHAPLAGAALCIQDDLILMRRSEHGWYLAAASLCFPSSWNLAEKFGRPIRDIHSPVPLGPEVADRIDRIFDNLKPEMPVWRANWSLDGDGDLRHDRRENHRTGNRNKLSDTIWFRSEYQTLHKLPDTGDILFTVRIATGTLEEFLREPGGTEKVAELARQYAGMSHEQLAYKGIADGSGRLVEWMDSNGVTTHE